MENKPSAEFAVGIDLGTTNSVVAFSRLADAKAKIELLPIPQIVAPGTVEIRTQLPSFLYLAAENEAANFMLPWDKSGRDYAVGELRAKAGGRRADAHRGRGEVVALPLAASIGISRSCRGARRRKWPRFRRSRRRAAICSTWSPPGITPIPTRR